MSRTMTISSWSSGKIASLITSEQESRLMLMLIMIDIKGRRWCFSDMEIGLIKRKEMAHLVGVPRNHVSSTKEPLHTVRASLEDHHVQDPHQYNREGRELRL